jgi:hypothetical protein
MFGKFSTTLVHSKICRKKSVLMQLGLCLVSEKVAKKLLVTGIKHKVSLLLGRGPVSVEKCYGSFEIFSKSLNVQEDLFCNIHPLRRESIAFVTRSHVP